MDQLTLRGSWNSWYQEVLWLLWPRSSLNLLLPLTDPGQSHYCLLKSQVRWDILLEGLGFWQPDVNWCTSHSFVSSSKGRGQDWERVNGGTYPGAWLKQQNSLGAGDWDEGPERAGSKATSQLPVWLPSAVLWVWPGLLLPAPSTQAHSCGSCGTVTSAAWLLSHGGGKEEKPGGQKTTHQQHVG